MKAVVFHGVGEIPLEDVPEPKIKDPNNAIVRLTASAVCGTDPHMVRGTVPGMKPGTILGHEGVGVVEDLGRSVRSFKEGDRVVICSAIACGYCSYCRDGCYAQCDNANPNGPLAGTAFFGGPAETGSFNGPSGYFGAELAEIRSGDTVAVFGCGPVGQFVIASARRLPADSVNVSHRHGDQQEPQHQYGELQPSHVRADAGRPGARWNGEPERDSDPGRAHDLGDRGLQGIRFCGSPVGSRSNLSRRW